MSNLIILRPQNLFYLFKSLDKLSGIGEKKIRVLEKKIGPNIINLLCYLPIKSIDRHENTSLKKNRSRFYYYNRSSNNRS